MTPTAPLVEGSASTPVQRTAGGIDTVQPLASVSGDLAAVRRATSRFHNPDVAAAAGYVFGEPCVSSPAGAMGIHATNPALIADQTIDPERPEMLLYQPQPNGGLKLIGVEYMRPVLLRNTTTGQVAPWFPALPWTSNFVVANSRPQLFGQSFDGFMPGHDPSMPWHWDLHVWLWASNPDGLFAQWNPSISCN